MTVLPPGTQIRLRSFRFDGAWGWGLRTAVYDESTKLYMNGDVHFPKGQLGLVVSRDGWIACVVFGERAAFFHIDDFEAV